MKLRKFGTVDRRPGSGRGRSARTDENVDTVESLVLSQEDKTQSHRTVRELSREAGIHRSSVSQIIHKDLPTTGKQQPALFRAAHDFQKKDALFAVSSLRDDNVITSTPT